MKTRLFTAITLTAMAVTVGSAFAQSLQNERKHDGGPGSFNGTFGGGQNLVLPYAATEPRDDVTSYVIGAPPAVHRRTCGFSLQNERKHDGSSCK